MVISSDYTSHSQTSLTETQALLDRQSSLNYSTRSYGTASPLSSSSQSTSVFSRAVICILMAEMFEKFAFCGIISNLVLFSMEESQLNFTAFKASVLSHVFQGTCYTIPLLGGWLSDTVAGTFSVIFVGIIIYLFGAVLLPVGAISQRDKHVSWAHSTPLTNTTFKRAVYLSGLFLVAFGTGAIKTNAPPFGADQLKDQHPDIIRAFFIWHYWFFNIGAFFSFAFLVYVQDYSYFYGYLIPVASIAIMLIIFLAGERYYQKQPPAGSAIFITFKIVKDAIEKSYRPVLGSRLAEHWLDRAKTCFGGNYLGWQVEYVKRVFRLLPIFATFILYWTIYAQMSTSMVYQGKFMDTQLTSSFHISTASLPVLDIVSMFVLIPIMDKLLYPMLSKNNINFSQLQRIGIGMIFATLSMVYAGVLELYRTKNCCTGSQANVSNISIFYQVPQYTLIGISEVFTAVTGLEMAYSEAPELIQGIVVGCFFLTRGLGTYVGVAVTVVVNLIAGESSTEWYPDKHYINEGKLAYYFFFLAGLMLLNFILYIFVAASFKAKMDAANRIANANEGFSSAGQGRARANFAQRNSENTSFC